MTLDSLDIQPRQHDSNARSSAPHTTIPSPISISVDAPPNNQPSELRDRFSAILQPDGFKFDILDCGDWLMHVPARLGSDELLDMAALAFLDALEFLDGGVRLNLDFSTYEAAVAAFEAMLQEPNQTRTPDTLAAIGMIRLAQVRPAIVCCPPTKSMLAEQAQMWTSNSAQEYMAQMGWICQLLNETVQEGWNDPFGRAVRFGLVQVAVCGHISRTQYRPIYSY